MSIFCTLSFHAILKWLYHYIYIYSIISVVMLCHMTPLDYGEIKRYQTTVTSNIRRTLVGNKIVDHSDVVGASPVGAAPTTSLFSTLTSGFKGFSKDSRKAVRESFKCWGLVRLILETWRYIVVSVYHKNTSPGNLVQCHRHPAMVSLTSIHTRLQADLISLISYGSCGH